MHKELVSEKNHSKKCCGTCEWHFHEDISDGWVCVNDQSDYVADWTDYEHCCDEWEGRE